MRRMRSIGTEHVSEQLIIPFSDRTKNSASFFFTTSPLFVFRFSLVSLGYLPEETWKNDEETEDGS